MNLQAAAINKNDDDYQFTKKEMTSLTGQPTVALSLSKDLLRRKKLKMNREAMITPLGAWRLLS